jgi:hypothetical protein
MWLGIAGGILMTILMAKVRCCSCWMHHVPLGLPCHVACALALQALRTR